MRWCSRKPGNTHVESARHFSRTSDPSDQDPSRKRAAARTGHRHVGEMNYSPLTILHWVSRPSTLRRVASVRKYRALHRVPPRADAGRTSPRRDRSSERHRTGWREPRYVAVAVCVILQAGADSVPILVALSERISSGHHSNGGRALPVPDGRVSARTARPRAALGLPERATLSRAWAKEAVFPAERFPGAATRGPEMRSTGEVMAGGATAAEAYAPRVARRRRSRRGGQDRPAAPGRGAIVEPMRDILEVIEQANAAGEKVVGRDRDRRRSARRRASPARRWSSARAAGSSARSRAAVSRPTWSSARRRSSPARRRASSTTASADGEAWEVGLSCGGEIDVWVELADTELWSEVRALLDDDGYGMLYTDTAPARSASSAACSSDRAARGRRLRRGGRGPAARRDLRRRRGRRAPLRLRQAARLAHDGRRRARGARDARAGPERRPRSSRPGPTRSSTGSTSARSS